MGRELCTHGDHLGQLGSSNRVGGSTLEELSESLIAVSKREDDVSSRIGREGLGRPLSASCARRMTDAPSGWPWWRRAS